MDAEEEIDVLRSIRKRHEEKLTKLQKSVNVLLFALAASLMVHVVQHMRTEASVNSVIQCPNQSKEIIHLDVFPKKNKQDCPPQITPVQKSCEVIKAQKLTPDTIEEAYGGTPGPWWDTEYCQTMLKTRKANENSGQFLQDLFVFNNFFRDKKNIFDGFFVESGAAGLTGSQTLFYERCLGWEGLCVEPLEEFQEELTNNRTCTLVKGCIGANSEDAFDFHPGQGISFLTPVEKGQNTNDGLTMKCMSLEDILDKYANGRRKIDFWSLDVEGLELTVLESVDFDKIDVTALLIEDHRIDHRELSYLMTAKNMLQYFQLGGDAVWVKRDSNLTLSYVSSSEDGFHQRILELLQSDAEREAAN